MIKKETISNAVTNIDDKYIEKAANYSSSGKISRSVLLKITALAACLCIMAVSLVYIFKSYNMPDTSKSYAQSMAYNDNIYYICSVGEAEILKKCGLPESITAELAGKSLGFFDNDDNNFYQISNISNGDAELFEYAPKPNNNVYIFRIGEKYCAAIRHDEEGYHGLTE